MYQLETYFDRAAVTTPFCAGVSDVLFAFDRGGVLAAVEKYPELLTDRGEAAFRVAVLLMEQMCPGRLAQLVTRSAASIQAIREALA